MSMICSDVCDICESTPCGMMSVLSMLNSVLVRISMLLVKLI